MSTARIYVDEVVEQDSHRSFGHELISGVRAGQVAGLAMAGALMALSGVFLNKGLFYPLEVIAASVFGESAIGRLDVPTLVVGLLVHQFGPALAWGVVFGIVVWLFKPRRSVALMMWGILVGAIAQIVDVHILLPLLSGDLSGRLPFFGPLQHENLWAQHIPVVASWLGHLVFGLSLSLYPWRYDPAAGSFD